mmetsp:Transcript_25747/g.62528  ORF Transcript_25747/g.62528 Transcript_25747/m.62528 type:complete len:187 (-) Transcript_25747:105-665(-)
MAFVSGRGVSLGQTRRPALAACSRTVRAMASGSIHDISVNELSSGESISLGKFKGKPVLAFNAACQCGYTRSGYTMMKNLANKYDGKLQVIAFPSNDFGMQEPGTPDEIRQFIQSNFGETKILMTEKSAVKGSSANPVFALAKPTLGEPSWNFDGKLLFDKDGKPSARFTNASSEGEISAAIDKLI